MLKYFSFIFIISTSLSGQVIFQDKFNSYSLSTYTTLYTTTLYTTVPSPYLQMNEGFPNTIGSSLHPNAPFHTDSLRYKGWGIVFNDVLKDTFLVSTSYVDSNRAISRWFILPPISGISVNSVLHWKAMAPDPNNADGYAVYISTNTSINDTVIFSNSNKVFQISDNSTSGGGEKSQWNVRSLSLANYAGQSIRIAFKNISKQKYQLWVDDITIENLSYGLDASIENIGNVKYVLVNQPFVLSARIKNNGYQNISNINLAYSIQGISSNNQSFALNTSLLPLTTTTLAFTNTLSINTGGLYEVKMWVNQINGQNDQNHFNDTISYYLSVLSNSVTPKILVEQMTDALLPDAPANQDTLNYYVLQDTNIIAVQIHQQDSLKYNQLSSLVKNFNLPDNSLSAMINRNYLINDNKNYFFKNELRKKVQQVKAFVSPCQINITNMNVDTSLRNIQLDVNVEFLQNTVGDYRVVVYLIENNIYGNPLDTSINGYNQLSSYYFTPYSNYFQQGYFSNTANAFVLNAYQYKHRWVLNSSITSAMGDNSVIPNNPLMSNSYTKTYSVNIPASANNVFRYHFDNMYLVAFVYEHDTLIENRKVLNADIQKVTTNNELVSVQVIHSDVLMNVFPNPANQWLYLKVHNVEKWKAELLNITGQKVMDISAEMTDISMLSDGIYFVKLNTSSDVIVKKIIVQK
ncbi:MAG: hypothetical protein OHK0036_09010 [Bacteroidia bacterium]